MNTVRWGLVSTANINRRLIPAIRASRRGALAAVASRSLSAAQAYAARWEIPLAFGGYQEMLDSDQVDAVYISLPNHLHAEWTIRALRAGVHVLCEKPFATSLAEVDAMFAASRESGRVLAEAFMYRHHPQTKIAGEWARSGRLGDLLLVTGTFNFSIEEPHYIRLVKEFGGGSLWDIGVYPLSFAQFIFAAAPEWVMGAQKLGSSGVDESFAGQMVYPGARFAQINSSFRSPFYTRAEVIGSAGRLVLNRPFTGIDQGRRLIFHPAQGDPEEIAVPEVELYAGEVKDLHAAILDGAAPYLQPDETRNHVRTALALYESADRAAPVRLEP